MKNEKCKCCTDFFAPSPFIHHQEYCTKASCQAESNRASSRKYRRKKKDNQEYKEKNKEFVRKNRFKNPGYSKKYRKKIASSAALSDIAIRKTQAMVGALSDLACSQGILIKGLISLSTDALSDTFGDVEKAIYIRGLELSKDSSQQLIMEKTNAKEINSS